MTDFGPLNESVERACASIAPTWPLDRFIAVNPFWPRIGKPLPEVAGDLAALSGAHLLMPRAWYAEEWRKGRFTSDHLHEAISESGFDVTEDDVIASFWIREPISTRRPLVVDVLQALRKQEHEHSWREFVTERISRFCASYFDDGQAQVGGAREGGLYQSWRDQAQADPMPSLFMELAGYRTALGALPARADQMFIQGVGDLGVGDNERENYFSALLLDINGWASWTSYLRFQKGLAGETDHHIRDLLAIRLAWEWILLRASGDEIAAEWKFAMQSWAAIGRAAHLARAEDWILQRAVEIALLSKVRPELPKGFGVEPPATPKLQAAFCIDVRSEPMRRALESQSPDIQTYGAAGHFGIPIAYEQLSADEGRPQLPALLAPKYRVTDTNVPKGLEDKRRARLEAKNAWKAFKSSSLSSFAFVDAMGLFFAKNIYQDAFTDHHDPLDHHDRAGLTADEDATRMPRVTANVDGTNVTVDEKVAMAEGFLRAIGLTAVFARVVLLIGHGSESRNNAHAAGLDCGACSGQPGSVNSRAACALFNDEAVRTGLAAKGIQIPETTVFMPGIHNTTTDDITLFLEGVNVAAHQNDLVDVRAILARASATTRRERAPRLGLENLNDTKLHTAVKKRASNWAEVRPEWGLSGNALFIVAPRERTRHMNFEGRAFLHDYRPEEDPTWGILEAIVAGPVVVGHWINFQYYASTVDNARYGSGDKTLHNIVGGHLGVLEGNGGDLRVGLALQSLHDGEKWQHAPLRLAVMIEASRPAINSILDKHQRVKALVVNEWIHLFQIDTEERSVYACRNNGWTEA
ncbi:MAG TPA: DUF2309 domain-containing protein [Kofleriaceae bacterium]|jgi:hypothetical protein